MAQDSNTTDYLIYEYNSKNCKPNTSKYNPAAHTKIIYNNWVGRTRNKRRFDIRNTIDIIHHINKSLEKNYYLIISEMLKRYLKKFNNLCLIFKKKKFLNKRMGKMHP